MVEYVVRRVLGRNRGLEACRRIPFHGKVPYGQRVLLELHTCLYLVSARYLAGQVQAGGKRFGLSSEVPHDGSAAIKGKITPQDAKGIIAGIARVQWVFVHEFPDLVGEIGPFQFGKCARREDMGVYGQQGARITIDSRDAIWIVTK